MARHTVSFGMVDGHNRGVRNCEATFEYELQDTDKGPGFSMSASVWNRRKTDTIMGGQCCEEVYKMAGSPDGKIRRMLEVWRRWHLNDMKAGCEHQRTEKWDERPIDPSKPASTYVTLKAGQCGCLSDYKGWNMLTWITRKEHPAGLLSEACPVCGYKFGSMWLYEAIPAEVIAEIKSWDAA